MLDFNEQAQTEECFSSLCNVTHCLRSWLNFFFLSKNRACFVNFLCNHRNPFFSRNFLKSMKTKHSFLHIAWEYALFDYRSVRIQEWKSRVFTGSQAMFFAQFVGPGSPANHCPSPGEAPGSRFCLHVSYRNAGSWRNFNPHSLKALPWTCNSIFQTGCLWVPHALWVEKAK